MTAVYATLRRAEHDTDAAIRSSAELIATMVEARKQAKLQFGIGQGALERVGKALAAKIEGRREMARCHADLAQVGVDHQFDWTGMGDVDETQPAQFAPRGAEPLAAPIA